jgi:7-cyano-7-deazaguanine synthase
MNTIVLLSGGLDSTAALFWARENRTSVRAIAIDYAQAHKLPELARARAACATAGVVLAAVKLSFPWPPMAGDVLPGRNLALLTIAAAQGATRGGGVLVEVVIGSCAADQATFHDCRPEFFQAAEKALSLALGVETRIVAPWIDRTKAQIIDSVRQIPGALECISRSWSCYRPVRRDGQSVACHACNACKLRKDGFDAAQEIDSCP